VSRAELIAAFQTLAILGVGIMEAMLIRELRETRKFMERMRDDVLGSVGANMALNTLLAAISAILPKVFHDRGKNGTQSDA
jgi:hypothetical protein